MLRVVAQHTERGGLHSCDSHCTEKTRGWRVEAPLLQVVSMRLRNMWGLATLCKLVME